MALLVGHRTCDLQVAGSSIGWAQLRNGFGQATYTCVPLSPCKPYSLVPAKGAVKGRDLFGWESNCGPGGK